MDKITTLSVLLELSVLLLVSAMVLFDAKKRSYKKRGLLIDKREDEIATLNAEIRKLVEGTKLEKAHIKAKYKLQYSIESQAWAGCTDYGGTSGNTFTGFGSLFNETTMI
tara:strand:+ start:449 stop:778 length:330 start_codon:yes stop_codon:yes gene_type:complete